jgi:phosphoadenosine phosphosulfate reductase
MAVDPYRVVNDLREVTDEVLVGVSGKDSFACLDLICSHKNPFRRVQPFFMYLVPGLSFQEKYLAYLERRYKLSVWRIPHWQLGAMLQEGTYRPLTTEATTCPAITISQMEKYLRVRSGIQWIAGGHKICDSLLRRLQVGLHKGMDVKHWRTFPLAFWSNSAVYTYLRARKIPLSPDYLMYGHSFRNCLLAEDLAPIRERYPADYEKIREVFPYVEATFYATS